MYIHLYIYNCIFLKEKTKLVSLDFACVPLGLLSVSIFGDFGFACILESASCSYGCYLYFLAMAFREQNMKFENVRDYEQQIKLAL